MFKRLCSVKKLKWEAFLDQRRLRLPKFFALDLRFSTASVNSVYYVLYINPKTFIDKKLQYFIF